MGSSMTPIQFRCVLAKTTSVAEREVDSVAIPADGSDGRNQSRMHKGRHLPLIAAGWGSHKGHSFPLPCDHDVLTLGTMEGVVQDGSGARGGGGT